MLKMKARRWFHEVAPELIEGDGAAAVLAWMCQDVHGCPRMSRNEGKSNV